MLPLEKDQKMMIAGFSTYSRDLDYVKFREIADEIGATLWQILLTLQV